MSATVVSLRSPSYSSSSDSNATTRPQLSFCPTHKSQYLLIWLLSFAIASTISGGHFSARGFRPDGFGSLLFTNRMYAARRSSLVHAFTSLVASLSAPSALRTSSSSSVSGSTSASVALALDFFFPVGAGVVLCLFLSAFSVWSSASAVRGDFAFPVAAAFAFPFAAAFAGAAASVFGGAWVGGAGVVLFLFLSLFLSASAVSSSASASAVGDAFALLALY